MVMPAASAMGFEHLGGLGMIFDHGLGVLLDLRIGSFPQRELGQGDLGLVALGSGHDDLFVRRVESFRRGGFCFRFGLLRGRLRTDARCHDRKCTAQDECWKQGADDRRRSFHVM